MAMIYKKRRDSSNCVTLEIGTDNVEVPHSERHRIIVAWLNDPKFSNISAFAQGQISQINLGNTINAPDGLVAGANNARKQTIHGSGWYEVKGNSSSVSGAYFGKVDCFIMRINKAAYDVLSANGKADISNVSPAGMAHDDILYPQN